MSFGERQSVWLVDVPLRRLGCLVEDRLLGDLFGLGGCEGRTRRDTTGSDGRKRDELEGKKGRV
jgi:hypothetical protein